MVLVNLRFYMRQNFYETNPQFGQAPLEYFVSRLIGLKTSKNISLKGRQFIDLPGASTRLGPGLTPVPVDPAADHSTLRKIPEERRSDTILCL